MKDFVELGQVPWRETPTPMGDPEYRRNAQRECEAFVWAIRNYLGYEPTGACLTTKAFEHGDGTEYQVVCYFDKHRLDAVDYAHRCERQVPATWADGGVRPPQRIVEASSADVPDVRRRARGIGR
jgi:hypothetical protein